MKKLLLLCVLVGVGAGVLLVPGARSSEGADARRAAASPPAAADSGVEGVLYARPFTLAAPYAFDWQAAPEPLREGVLLVLAVDPARAEPKDEIHPVLYGGARTLERVNAGSGSGRLVAILPGPVDLDLAATRFWFGAPELPERVTPEHVASELAAAVAAGVAPFSAEEVASARAAGGAPLALAGRDELRRVGAELVRVHAPDEQDLISGLLAPRVR